jgi:hypothetical protein
MLLLHAPHHHTKMLGFEDNGDTFGFEDGFQGIADLLCEALLRLQSPRKHIDDPGDLAEADDVFIRHVTDVYLADKWQEMVFAEAIALDIGDDDHAVGFGRKHRAIDNGLEILAVAFCEELERFGSTLGGFEEPCTLRVFADDL